MPPPQVFNPLGFGQAFATPGGQSPLYGFSYTYQPSPQAQALGRVIQILQDPRNAWMGLGMTRGIGKFLPQAGEYFNPPMMKGLNAGGSLPAKGPTAMGQTQTAREWAQKLEGAWQRHDQATGMISPAIHPVIRERMVHAMNLKPLGYRETMELRSPKLSPESHN